MITSFTMFLFKTQNVVEILLKNHMTDVQSQRKQHIFCIPKRYQCLKKDLVKRTYENYLLVVLYPSSGPWFSAIALK